MRRSLPLLALLAAAPALAQPLAISSPNSEYDGFFGSAVSGVPDADGDGWGDFVVGAPWEDVSGDFEAGRVYLFSGATGTLLHTLESPNAENRGFFGYSVAGVDDVDGDGRGDLLVGAYSEDAGTGVFSGRAYVFSGATGTLLYTLVSPNAESGGFFGLAVSGVPDVNGDGRGDLLVGAYKEDLGLFLQNGRAYLYSGATGDLLHILVSPNAAESSDFGTAVSGVADADGDGRGDLLVGAYNENTDGQPGYSRQGRAYLYSGATGLLLHTLESPNPRRGGEFGWSVSGVLDADGDGRGDLLVGTGAAEQRVYLFSGATGALLHELVSPDEEGRFYGGVAGLPDVDGDGRGDLGVGAQDEYNHGVLNAGRAYVFSGRTGERLYTLRSPNAEVDGYFGAAVAGLGDVNGDGLGDGVVAAVYETVGDVPYAGRVYLYRTGGRADGKWEGAEVATVTGEPEAEHPAAVALSVAPNPLTSGTALRVALPRPAEATLEVLDVLGRRVALVHEGMLAAGAHALRWEPAAGLRGGVYLVRLRVAGEAARTQRVTLAR